MPSTKQPKRDLARERDALKAQYDSPGRSDATRSEFAALYRETLKHEKNSTQWTGLTELFPRDVCILAMEDAGGFAALLKLDKLSVEIWRAGLLLQTAEEKLKNAIDQRLGMSEKTALQEAFCERKSECLTLWFNYIKPLEPANWTELRQAFNEVGDCHTQAKLLHSARLVMQESFPALFPADSHSKANYKRFEDCLAAEVLYDRMLDAPNTKTRLAYYAKVGPLADQLRAAIVAQGTLDECDKYPSVVQYRVLGELQHVLVRELEGRIPLPDIRKAVRELKGEFDPDWKTEKKLRLLNYLGHKTPVLETLTPQVGCRVLLQLPAKLILEAIKTVTPRALKKHIHDLLLQMHPLTARNTIREYGYRMVGASPAELRRGVGMAFDTYMKWGARRERL